MKRLNLGFLSLMLLLAPTVSRSHGEDKPGPNGGEIRMPGAFHTEVRGKSREFEIFLLDIGFKNPTIENSSVEVRVKPAKPGSKETALTCRASKAARPPRFVCLSSSYLPVAGDVLLVKAKRGNLAGNEAEYKLPLLVAKSGVEDSHGSAHDSHHGEGH